MYILVFVQVTAVIDQPHESFDRKVVPCFGLAFANYIHSRIFLSRTDLVIKGATFDQGKQQAEKRGNKFF